MGKKLVPTSLIIQNIKPMRITVRNSAVPTSFIIQNTKPMKFIVRNTVEIRIEALVTWERFGIEEVFPFSNYVNFSRYVLICR